ncbi:MAG: 23S rRNA (pseudouridine(1915)-N(3))-methyltransferase RlmH [Alphaproteobacteria bacterium]|nr:23S rRNA (pseudouridine(1915)-N(3))-methyltransferase RlmH [Alphaproteobacteria bacterium]
MEFVICAIGHLKSGPELDLINKYIKQTSWKVTVKEFEYKKNGSVDEIKWGEAELLFSGVPKGAKIVVLDERGKTMPSVDFAKKISDWQSSVAFLIGGAYGHNDETRKKADMLLSFGQMTWPHFLVRAMLTEQIYRAKTILDGHPYHKV